MGASCQWLNATRRRRWAGMSRKIENESTPQIDAIENYASGRLLDHAVASGGLGLIERGVGALGKAGD
jgi:hypothetical protein